jgi:hypothetical protein
MTLASSNGPALSTTVTAAAPKTAPSHSARTGAGRASSITRTANTRTYRETKPARERNRTAATWFSV